MQTFEIEIDGIRTEIGVAQFFDKTASGELDAEERVWLDGVQGRARDVDERLVNKELIFYLKNTVQEIEIERIFSSETSNFLDESSVSDSTEPIASKALADSSEKRGVSSMKLFWTALVLSFAIMLTLFAALGAVLLAKPSFVSSESAETTELAPDDGSGKTAPEVGTETADGGKGERNAPARERVQDAERNGTRRMKVTFKEKAA